LYKRASKLRGASNNKGRRRRPPPQPWQWIEEETLPSVEKFSRRSSNSLEEWVEILLKEEESQRLENRSADAPEDARNGLVIETMAGRCRVLLSSGEELHCRLRDDLASTQRTDLAVGDRVLLSTFDDSELGVVETVLPRRTTLSRPDPSGKKVEGKILERVIVANVDRVVIVASVKNPPLRPRLLDRYLIAIERGGARPIICLNKTDLLPSPADIGREVERIQPFRALGIDTVTCSATRSEGLQPLRTLLQGMTSVLVGHSGVGKSSLINRLLPKLQIHTQSVNDVTGRGRHSTTASTLYVLDPDTRIIDTPGIREFGLMKVSPRDLRWYFHEFDDYAGGCHFSDCTHLHEPKCAVKSAVENGCIPEIRFDTYRRLMGELE